MLAAVSEDRPSPAAVFIGGEAGIGKSRLAAEAAATLATDGALVLHGACVADGGAFDPFGRMAADLVAMAGPADIPARVRDAFASVGPDLGRLSGLDPGAVALDPLQARGLVFDAFARVFASASAARTLVVVIDDLQWASVPAVLLLGRLLRTATDGRLVFLATFRDSRAELSDALVQLLGEVARSPSMRRLDVRRARRRRDDRARAHRR